MSVVKAIDVEAYADRRIDVPYARRSQDASASATSNSRSLGIQLKVRFLRVTVRVIEPVFKGEHGVGRESSKKPKRQHFSNNRQQVLRLL